jgi:hypothetical protein
MKNLVRTLMMLFGRRPKPLLVTVRPPLGEREPQRLRKGVQEGVSKRAALALDTVMAAERIQMMQEIAQASPDLRPALDAMETDFIRKLVQVRRPNLRRLT